MKKELILMLICLLAVAICNAQTGPTQKQIDSLRLIWQKETEPKIDEFVKDKPIILICFNEKLKTSHLFTIKGLTMAGKYYDGKHRPLPDWVRVVSVMEAKKLDKSK